MRQAGYFIWRKIMNRDSCWITKDGRKIAVKDMATSHIKNTLAMLKAKGFVDLDTLEFYLCGAGPNGEMAQLAFEQELMDLKVSPFIDLFEEELNYRLKNQRGNAND
jgi:hypothetical protein